MKTRSFTLIVAAIAITGIILTALFGTTDVQKNLIPALIIWGLAFSLFYRAAEKQSENGRRGQTSNNDTAVSSKHAVSEGSLHSEGALGKSAA